MLVKVVQGSHQQIFFVCFELYSIITDTDTDTDTDTAITNRNGHII